MFVPLFTGLNLIGYDSNPYYLKSYIKPVNYIWPVQSYLPINNLELDSGSLISSLFQRFAAYSANQINQRIFLMEVVRGLSGKRNSETYLA